MPERKDMRARWRMCIVDLPRYAKRFILVSIDFSLLCAALWIPTSIRYEQLFLPEGLGTALLLLSGPVITIVIFAYTGLYRLVTRYISFRGTIQIFFSVGLAVLIWSLLVFMSGQHGVSRAVRRRRLASRPGRADGRRTRLPRRRNARRGDQGAAQAGIHCY